MFVDEAKICLVSGRGGDGIISFRRRRHRPKGGPDGGDGGDGGDVILRANPRVRTLLKFTQRIHWKAEKGEHGKPHQKRGRNGKDLLITVPVGTVVKQLHTQETLGDLTQPGQQVTIARGGAGGRGNARFKSSTRRAPRIRERGEPGEEVWVKLELKLLADVGLIGAPNAGKSTLLSVISAKRPKIAAYPFTTLEPNLGVVQSNDEGLVAVDIPGLIEGAHTGKGLGDRFLKHIERTRLLLHLVDVSGWEGRDPLEDYRMVNQELQAFSPALAQKPQLVVGNKIDLIDEAAQGRLRERFGALGVEIYLISAAHGQGVPKLLRRCLEELERMGPPEAEVTQEAESKRRIYCPEPPETDVAVVRDADGFHVHGRAVRRLSRLSLEEPDALEYLQERLSALGVFAALHREGVREGDRIVIGDVEFEYREDEDG